VKEESIDGVCENIYEVRELPKYMIVDRPEMVPYPEACPEEKYFGLTKTKDVGKCEKRSSFNSFAPGQFGDQVTYSRQFKSTLIWSLLTT
jgi:Lipoprotein amino terminal region